MTRRWRASAERAFVEAVVAVVARKPVNLLAGSASELTVQAIAALGVQDS